MGGGRAAGQGLKGDCAVNGLKRQEFRVLAGGDSRIDRHPNRDNGALNRQFAF